MEVAAQLSTSPSANGTKRNILDKTWMKLGQFSSRLKIRETNEIPISISTETKKA
jgi:hypothetical protein